MFVRRRRWNSLKLLLWFLFQHPLAISLAIRVLSANAWLQQERGLYTSCGLFRYALYHGRAPEARFDEGR